MRFSFVEADMGGQDGQMEVRERVAAYVDAEHGHREAARYSWGFSGIRE